MARAIICDRCGKVYKNDGMDTNPDILVFKGGRRMSEDSRYDLCEECVAKLLAFMNADSPTMEVDTP